MCLRKFARSLPYQNVSLYLIFCLMPGSVSLSTVPMCQLQKDKVSGYSRDGDIILGGTFPVHDRVFHNVIFTEKPALKSCNMFGYDYYKWLQAMVFAVEKINMDPNLLPNITLGFRIHDSCMVVQRSLEGILWMLTGQEEPIPNYQCWKNRPPVAIIGDATSTRSSLLAHILGLYRRPQVSYSASLPLLSDKTLFPSFFRTIPSDDFQFPGLAQLVQHFDWTWVGLLADDDDYGQLGIQIMQKELARSGACVAFSEYILKSRDDRDAVRITQIIKNSTAKAIVIFSNGDDIMPLLEEMVRQNVTEKTLVASEAWSSSPLLTIQSISDVMTGTIGFSIFSGEMPGFKDHLTNIHPSNSPGDIFIREFWGTTFGCTWVDNKTHFQDNMIRLCTGDETLESLASDYKDVSSLTFTFNIYMAVNAIALALQDLGLCTPGSGPFSQGSCAGTKDFQLWQLLHYVKQVRLPGIADTGPFFDQGGNPPARYDIVNWQRSSEGTTRHVKVGHFDASAKSGHNLILNASAIRWTSGSTEVPLSVCSPSCPPGFTKAGVEGEPACCFQCLQCPQGEISNQTDSTKCSMCPWDQWPNEKHDTCITKIIDFLSYEEPLGAALTTVSIISSVIPVAILLLNLHYRNTPIVKANNSSLSYLLLLSLMLCFLCSLTFIGYPTKEKCLLRQAAFGIPFALCISCILAKTILVVIAFNATKPNSDLKKWFGPQISYILVGGCTFIQVLLCIFWLTLSPPFSHNNVHVKPGMIIVECSEGSPIAFWCMLGYLGLLATISFIVAFLARKLPDNFNEAKLITFSMLAFLSVWLSFIPAYLSTTGKYMVAMEIFAILSSSSSLVSCIFFPKCYIILMRPEMNTREYLLGRGKVTQS